MSSLNEIRKQRGLFEAERARQAREKEHALAAIAQQVAEGRVFADFAPRSQALILSMSPAAWSRVECSIYEEEKKLAAENRAAQARKGLL